MIRVVVEDLASIPADAVVRPATASLAPSSPALRRLEQVGGAALREALTLHEELEVGAAVVTPGGGLAAELVIHAVILSADRPDVTPRGVELALTGVLQRANDFELARIAMPPVGAGPDHLALEDAIRVLGQVLRRDLPHKTYPKEVCIVVDTPEEQLLVERLLPGDDL